MRLSCLFRACAATLFPSILAFAGPPTIETVAGSDLVGDGAPASKAYVSILEGVCTDNAENVYIADADNHRVRKIDRSGIITTLAGVGFPGFSGDGGPANQASLNSPYGITVDSGGNLYIADLGNNRIRVVSKDGTISTLAGGLAQPRNVALDGQGNLYVSEFGGNRVSRVGQDGSLTPVAGVGSFGFSGDGGDPLTAQLASPAAIAIDHAGTMYIADSGNARIRMIGGGKIETVLGGVDMESEWNLPLVTPTGVAVDRDGNLYVAHGEYPTILEWTTQTGIKVLPGTGRDLTVAQNGDIFIVGGEHLQQLKLDGTVVTLFSQSSFNFGDSGPGTKARFESVAGIASDREGTLTIADLAFRRLRQMTADGTMSTLPSSAYVSAPRSVTVDTAGHLFVADGTTIKQTSTSGAVTNVASKLIAPTALATDAYLTLYFADNNQVFSISYDNPPVLIAGTGDAGWNGDGSDATRQQLNGPSAIAVSAANEIYIADAGNHRIRKVTRNGAIETVAGTGNAGSGGDGGPAINADLNMPSGLVFDPLGNLWIADSANQTVRMIDRSGNIQAGAGTGMAGFSGDGGLAAYAQLSSPGALAADGAGNIYVADSGNLRVRRIVTGGTANLDTSSALAITNAASFQPGPLVGGSIVSLFGKDLGPAAGATSFFNTDGLLSSELGDTIVKFNGYPAPLYYVGANQINAQVPVEVAGTSSALVEVYRSGVVQANATVAIADANPGLFANNGQAAALNQDGSANMPENAAGLGSVVVLYGTGFGSTDPLDVTGGQSNPPLPTLLTPVSVTVGGANASILYAGDAPGFVGLTQINIVVPSSVPSGQAEVLVTAGSQTSPAGVFVSVR